jgi:hypothetical protein
MRELTGIDLLKDTYAAHEESRIHDVVALNSAMSNLRRPRKIEEDI